MSVLLLILPCASYLIIRTANIVTPQYVHHKRKLHGWVFPEMKRRHYCIKQIAFFLHYKDSVQCARKEMAKKNNNNLVSITHWKQFKIWKIYSEERTHISRDKKSLRICGKLFIKTSLSLARFKHTNFKVLLHSAPQCAVWLCSWMVLHSNFRQFKCAFTLYSVLFFSQPYSWLWYVRYTQSNEAIATSPPPTTIKL